MNYLNILVILSLIIYLVEGHGQLLISVDQASLEALSLVMKKEAEGGDNSTFGNTISMEPKQCSTPSDCVTEHCCGDSTSCCSSEAGTCGCQNFKSNICANGPIAVVANDGIVENNFGTADQAGAVTCVQRGTVKEKTINLSVNLFHPNILVNGEIQQQVDDYIFHSKFYGRLISEELMKSLMSRLNGKQIVAHLDEEQMEETVFEAIMRSAESLLTQFSGKEILELLTDLQLEELLFEERRRRGDL